MQFYKLWRPFSLIPETLLDASRVIVKVLSRNKKKYNKYINILRKINNGKCNFISYGGHFLSYRKPFWTQAVLL